MRCNFSAVGSCALASLLALTTSLAAQEPAAVAGAGIGGVAVGAATAAPLTAPDETQGTLTEQVIRGRVQLEAGNTAAMTILQNAAQQSLAPLVAAAGPEVLVKNPSEMPRTASFNILARQAAEAHYWWGVAADRFAHRDIAMTAFARSARFFLGDRSGIVSSAREALPNLRGALSEGLPLIAPDDTLESISAIAHANPVTGDRLWRPLRLKFNLADGTFAPTSGAAPASDTANAEPANAGIKPLEFLITDGKLFVSVSGRDPKASLAQVPPPFRGVTDDALPRVLKMATVVAGFVREVDGPNRGMWRQIVRVHYPHKSLAKNNRDDLPRAEALCLQFLKLHAQTRLALGLENPYDKAPLSTSPPLTTIWLSEVSALWPRDEDDPAVLASLGMVEMPKVNVPTTNKPPTTSEIEITPISRPWLAAGQWHDVPGDIIFFKLAAQRSEAEWLRELAHEYGHVVLPTFNGFMPPLEPFGNGTLGETLGMLWIAALPDEFSSPLAAIKAARKASTGRALSASSKFAPPATITPIADTVTDATAVQPATLTPEETEARDFAREVESHVTTNALAALNAWNAQGPGSPLRRDASAAGLQYLLGLGTYIERVYGSRVLSAAMRPLPRTALPPLEPTAEAAPANAVVGSGATGSLAVGAGGLPPGTLPGGVPVPPPPPVPPMQSVALLDSFAAALRNPFAANQTRLPIWLPGALSVPTSKLSATELIHRAPTGLKTGERATCWLFVPANAAALRIEWKTAPEAGPMTVEGGWKSSPLPPTLTGATHAVRIDTATRGGWQRIAFAAPADLTWSGAWFEKAPNAPAAGAPGAVAPRR